MIFSMRRRDASPLMQHREKQARRLSATEAEKSLWRAAAHSSEAGLQGSALGFASLMQQGRQCPMPQSTEHPEEAAPSLSALRGIAVDQFLNQTSYGLPDQRLQEPTALLNAEKGRPPAYTPEQEQRQARVRALREELRAAESLVASLKVMLADAELEVQHGRELVHAATTPVDVPTKRVEGATTLGSGSGRCTADLIEILDDSP